VGKIDELVLVLKDLKTMEPHTASVAEILHLAGSLVFLLYSCFDKVARGGLRPFYDSVTDNVNSASLWRTKDRALALTPSIMGGVDFFLRALPLIEPRVYYLGKVDRETVVIYSDAEWSPPHHPPLSFDKGLGGCIFVDSSAKGCALETPEHICNALAPRQTQIIPLELLASAGVLNTFADDVAGRDVILFIDNQSVCCALTKGSSKSRDIQTLSTAWHAMCMVLRCRVWIEWVPTDCNPADELSRYGTAYFEQDRDKIFEMILPEWANLRTCPSVAAALDWVFQGS
jgi:hypothetical protein